MKHVLRTRLRQTTDVRELQEVLAFEPRFRSNVPLGVFDYVAGGADGEHTIRLNRESFGLVELRRGNELDVASIDASTTILGQPVRYPILIGPTSAHSAMHPGGAAETFGGAAAAGATMILSAFSSPYGEVLTAADDPLWYQFYPEHTKRRARIERALELGCPVVCLTVDSPYQPHQERQLRNEQRNRTSNALDVVKEPFRDLRDRRVRTVTRNPTNPYRLHRRSEDTDWSIVETLRSFIPVPLIIKGVQTAEDALLAVEHGVDGIVVSNHGGRVLDYATPTLVSLPGIVDAVDGRLAVLIDSGFRTGADVLKALAMGADGVLIGRPVLWGLGTAGAAGVCRVMEILRSELLEAMARAGCQSLAEVDRTILQGDFT